MKASIIITTNNGKPDTHICEIGGCDVTSQSSEKELCILKKIFARHSEQIKKELDEEFASAIEWQPKEFRTGIINPSTGKEYILSDYYEDKDGNRHFTHEEAMKIWDSLPSWGPCTDEFHKQLAELVWDEEAYDWRKDVNGTGMDGFEYMTQKLGYELGGFRIIGSGALWDVGYNGCSWSSSFSGTSGVFLSFYTQSLHPSYVFYRGHGLPLRCLSEK